MIAENTTPKTQARGFSLFVFTGNLGIFIGPLIGLFKSTSRGALATNCDGAFSGGSLAKPAEQYPNVFGNVRVFRQYPYALSTCVAGLTAASAAVSTILFVNEVCKFDLLDGFR